MVSCLMVVLLLSACGIPEAVLSIGNPEDVGFSSERLARIAPIMQEYIDQQLVPCTIILVARHGKIVHFEAQGWKDVDARVPVKKDDIFRMFSMTKPITSVAVLILYEEGRLQLDDPVSLYIPTFKNQVVTADDETVPAEREITIRDILTHTSGTIGLGPGMTLIPDLNETSPISEIVDNIAKLPLSFQPGTSWEYGFGHEIAGVVVEVVSGKTLDEFFRERIFEPLGMKDSSFYLPEDKISRLIPIYTRMKEGDAWKLQLLGPAFFSSDKVNGPKVQFGGGGWGGGVLSTIQDYARFAQMLLNGGELDGVRILGRKTVQLMSTIHSGDFPISYGPGWGFGYGLGILEDITGIPNVGSVERFGWGGAASTYFFVDPEEDMIAILFTQVMGATKPLRFKPNHTFDTLVYSALE